MRRELTKPLTGDAGGGREKRRVGNNTVGVLVHALLGKKHEELSSLFLNALMFL